MPPTRVWDSASNFKFIRLYRELTCLWKQDDPGYRDSHRRKEAIQTMIRRLGLPDLTPAEIARRIKSLRATFLIELKKIKESMEIVNGENVYTYKPKLVWFDEMAEFISYTDDKLERRPKIKVETTFITADNETDDDINDDEEEATYLEDTTSVQDWDTLDDVQLPSTSNETRRKRSRSGGCVNTHEAQAMLRPGSHRTEDRKDEFDIFGMHVASQLRLLTAKRAIIAQEEMQTIMTKHRLRDLNIILKDIDGKSRKRKHDSDSETEQNNMRS